MLFIFSCRVWNAVAIEIQMCQMWDMGSSAHVYLSTLLRETWMCQFFESWQTSVSLRIVYLHLPLCVIVIDNHWAVHNIEEMWEIQEKIMDCKYRWRDRGLHSKSTERFFWALPKVNLLESGICYPMSVGRALVGAIHPGIQYSLLLNRGKNKFSAHKYE